MNGIDKPELQELPRASDRLSFLYVEKCSVSRSDGAVTLNDATGTTHVPAASLGVLLLGPGTTVTHRAMELLGDVGASVMWVGEKGIKTYSVGKPLTHSSRYLVAQAKLVSNIHTRLAVARKMYELRFPNENFSRMTMQQLRGREGSRVRAIYKKASEETGVTWNGREYDPNDYCAGDSVNQALSAANACLYGITHSVIAAIGCSPGLGFIHTGHDRSFVYDIADIYKADLTIPLAFEVARDNSKDIGSITRRKFRDTVADTKLMDRIAHDIRYLLLEDGDDSSDDPGFDDLKLWDNKMGDQKSGVAYGSEVK